MSILSFDLLCRDVGMEGFARRREDTKRLCPARRANKIFTTAATLIEYILNGATRQEQAKIFASSRLRANQKTVKAAA
jgi:hypothetical protein